MSTYSNSTRFLLSPSGPDAARASELYPAGRQRLGVENRRLDSGVDLPTPRDIVVPAHTKIKINLGVRAVCLRMCSPPPQTAYGGGTIHMVDPVGIPWAFFLLARSSISKTPLRLANSLGLIDLGYRGPIIACVENMSGEDFTLKKGRALFQLAAADLAPAEYEVVGAGHPSAKQYFGDGASVRGEGGFGSTGVSGSAAGL